ncbi:hypothetical protein ACWCRD_01720 [Streptomyces sp. NPDC002092]
MNTAARLMAELALAGRKVRRRRGLTQPRKRPAAPDFVRRDFTAEAPDQEVEYVSRHTFATRTEA